jgi:hypothetical protein
VLYIYHCYTVKSLDGTFVSLLACLSNLKSLTYYLDSEAAMLNLEVLAVTFVGRQLEHLTVSGIHSTNSDLADEELSPSFPSLQSLHVGS